MLLIRIRMYRKLAAQLWLWPLLFVLVMRALIPAGYMPSQTAQDHGLGFDLCVGSDRSTREIFANWLDQNPEPDQGSVEGTSLCAFCILASLSSDLPPVGAVASAPFLSLILLLLPEGTPVAKQGWAAGPALGPRAPPAML